MLTAYLVQGVHVRSLYIAFMIAVILGLVNSLVRPVLVLLTLPLTIVSLGLFLLVLNAFLLWLISWLIPGFDIDSFGASVIATLVISIFSWFINLILDPKFKS